LSDPDAIEQLRRLDPTGSHGLLPRVLQTYRTTLTRHLADMAAAWANAEVDRLSRIAHSLKSSSAAVGALAFAQDCADLEQLMRDRPGLPDGAPVEALIHEGESVLRAVGDMLQEQSGTSA
jgi:HPt (histidine-containing phosphotransfer) domain-containing protein